MSFETVLSVQTALRRDVSAKSQRASFWLNATVSVLFLGMIGGLILSLRTGILASTLMAAVLLVSGLLSGCLLLRGGRFHQLPTGITILIICITISGVPGAAFSQINPLEAALPYAVLLALRNIICFIIIPGSLDGRRCRIERVLTIWVFVACLTMVASAFFEASRSGTSLASEHNNIGLEEQPWVNNNTTGVFGAFAILVCLMSRSIPAWLKVSASLVSFYMLVLSESRTSIIALLAGGLLFLALRFKDKKGPVVCAFLAVVVAGVYINYTIPDYAEQLPVVDALQKKFASADPRYNPETSTRLDVILPALDRIAERPVIGLGFMAEDSRFEEGYLSLAVEAGLPGLMLYLVFLGFVVSMTYKLMKYGDLQMKELGLYLACTTMFICIHSLAERSHGFTVGYTISNYWATLVGTAYALSERPRRVSRIISASPRLPVTARVG